VLTVLNVPMVLECWCQGASVPTVLLHPLHPLHGTISTFALGHRTAAPPAPEHP
jgi:hypothetical protein